MKKFNEIRITAFTILGLVLMLFFGACSRVDPITTTISPVLHSQTGTFAMEDDCVDGSYLLKLENVPELANTFTISNFRNDPNVRLNASAEDSKIIIQAQSINLDGLIFSISGVITKTGQKLDFSYTIISENLNTGNICQARGFEI